jgi:hypothetical protein
MHCWGIPSRILPQVARDVAAGRARQKPGILIGMFPDGFT